MKIDGIIVVEGKTDVSFLSSFIDAEFVTTNGSDTPANTIEYLVEASKHKNIYVLTDPDYPGEKIRKILDEKIPNLHHCFVKKENSIKHGKVGVAESTIEEVLFSLKNAVIFDKESENKITMNDLYELGLIGNEGSSEKRALICEKLHIGHCNAKTFLKRINSCNIDINDIKKVL